MPIRVKNPEAARLLVNASNLMPWRSWIEVAVLDAQTGKPVEGFDKDDCIALRRDGTRLQVVWREGKDTLESIRAPEIKLRFHLYGKSKLYSFTFSD